MGLQELFPALSVTGIVGGIASAIGLSISSPPHLVEVADKISTPKYEIEIPSQISAEVTCSGHVWTLGSRERQKTEVTLSWLLTLDEHDKNLLKERRSINKNAEVSIKRKDTNGDLWPLKGGKSNEKLDILVEKRANRVMIIKLGEVPNYDGARIGWVYSWTGDNGELTCDNSDLILFEGSRKRIFGRTMRMRSRSQWVTNNDNSFPVILSLTGCNLEGRQAECSLKVFTNFDLDWSSKVTQRATLKTV